MKNTLGLLFASVGLLLSSHICIGQTADDAEFGAVPFRSYAGGTFDHIQMQNGSLYAKIPIYSVPELGRLKLDFSLVALSGVGQELMIPDDDDDGGGYDEYVSQASAGASFLDGVTFPSGGTTVNFSNGSVGLVDDQGIGFDYLITYHEMCCDGYGNLYQLLIPVASLSDGSGASHEMGFDSTNYALLHANDGSGWTADMPYSAGANASYPFQNVSAGTLVSVFDSSGLEYRGFPEATYGSYGSDTAAYSASYTVTDHSSSSPNHMYRIGDSASASQSLGGNSVSNFRGYIDSLNRVIPMLGITASGTSTLNTTASNCPNSSSNFTHEQATFSFTWTVPGESVPYIFCFTPIPIATNYYNDDGLSGTVATGDYDSNGWPTYYTWAENDGTVIALQSVVLPDGTYWGFLYDSAYPYPNPQAPYTYGSLTQIITPQGGTISYGYAMNEFCSSSGWGAPIQNISSRTANPLSGPSIVSGYSYNPTIEHNFTDTAMTQYNDVVHTFAGFSNSCGELETSTQWYQGAASPTNTPLKEVDTSYQDVYDPQDISAFYGSWPPAETNILPDQVVTKLNGTTVSTVTNSYDALFTDTQPWMAGNGPPYSYGGGGSSIVVSLNTPTTVDNGINKTYTQRLATTSSAYKSANMIELPASVTISNESGGTVAETTYGYDASGYDASGCSSIPCGLQTSVSQWLNTTSSYLTTSTQYDSHGMVIATTDAKGNTTNITPDSTDLFPSVIQYPATSGVAHNEGFVYDDNNGHLLQHTDQNSNVTNYTFDMAGRPWTIQNPDAGTSGYSTVYCYPNPTTVTTTTAQSTALAASPASGALATSCPTASGNAIVQTSVYDGLARPIQSILSSDPGGADTTTTSYNAAGQVASVTTPERSSSSSTDGTTTYNSYDGLGRLLQETEADGSTLHWSYSTTATTSTDEAGHSWVRTTDALGRLNSVTEPGGQLTDYTYDVLGNLTNVDQMGVSGDTPRERGFTYDSLSRLLTSSNPETGAIGYTYDANGNVLTKTDARSITTTYTYDTLNRLLHKVYNDGTPGATFAYDETYSSGAGYGFATVYPIGRLTSETTDDGLTGAGFQYDAMGRITTRGACTPRMCGHLRYDIGYTYDLAGNETQNGFGVDWWHGYYFEGFNPSYDAAGRLLNVAAAWYGGGIPQYPISNIQYSPVGESSATLGNGITENRSYDNRGRVQSIVVSPPSNPSSTLYSEAITYQANDNVSQIADSANGLWCYQYDNLNRLSSAFNESSCGGTPTYLYTYDSFGNRYPVNSTAGSPPWQFTAQNRMPSTVGFTYDSAGNGTNDAVSLSLGGHTYAYDAENRITQIDGALAYIYNAEGQRVAKLSGGSTVEEYLYDNDGHAVTAIAPDFTMARGELYAGGRHIATYLPDVYPRFPLTDHLGTMRVTADTNGNVIETCQQNPFGDGQSCSGTEVSTLHFTGKERDSESGNDYFGARYYGSTMGRFMSPDPSGLAYADQTNPQSLNLYSYVLNNPFIFIDPSGMTVVCNTETTDTPGQMLGVDSLGNPTYMSMSSDSITEQHISCHDDGKPDFNDLFEFTLDSLKLNNLKIKPLPKPMKPMPSNPQKTFWQKNWACVANVGQPVLLDDLDPASPGIGNIADASSQMSQASLQAAAAWSLERGLTVPLRSSIVRAGVETAEAFGRASAILAVAGVDVALIHAIHAEHVGCKF